MSADAIRDRQMDQLAINTIRATRFMVYGWNLLRVGDANVERIEQPKG